MGTMSLPFRAFPGVSSSPRGSKLYNNQVPPPLDIPPTLPPKQPLRSPGHAGGQEEVKESMRCLLTSTEHQDDLSYL